MYHKKLQIIIYVYDLNWLTFGQSQLRVYRYNVDVNRFIFCQSTWKGKVIIYNKHLVYEQVFMFIGWDFYNVNLKYTAQMQEHNIV